MAERMARVLADHGAERAWIVHGGDGLDEITTTTGTNVVELDGGEVRTLAVDPGAFGIGPASLADLRGGDPAVNAGLAQRVLAGDAGHHRDIVVLNAAAGLVVAGLAADMAEGVEAAPRVDRRRPGRHLPRPAGRRVRRRPHRGPVDRAASQMGSGAGLEPRVRFDRAQLGAGRFEGVELMGELLHGSAVVAHARRGVALAASSSDSLETSRSTSLTCSARRRRASVRSRGAKRATIGRW